MIIQESPFTYGPKSDSPPVCLGCHRKVDGKILCSTCGWPVCDEKCEKEPIHSENECIIFSSVKVRFAKVKNPQGNCPQYECITPLRVLLGKEKFPEIWNSQISTLESHNEERQKTDIWKVESINTVGFLHKVCKLQERFSSDLIHFACGILETNAFSSPSCFGYDVRYLYPKSSLFLHSCTPNVSHYIFKNSNGERSNVIHVRASLKIKKGQEFTLSYTQTLWPTLLRRSHLKEGKFFDCCCQRCSDPTELKTNFSTIKCSNCHNGWILNTHPLGKIIFVF